MKLIFVCMLAFLWGSVENLQAQDERKHYSEERLRLRAEWMALDMAERYNLDEKQVKELTEVNLTWMKQWGDMPRMPRYDGRRNNRPRHHVHHRGGCCESPRRTGCCCEACCEDGRHAVERPCYADARQPLSKEELEKREAERKKAFEERRAARDAYEQSLQKIMTEEQYKAYSERKRRR